MCDGFICITDAAEKSIAELRISNPRTWVVRNAIDIRRFERLLTKSVAREMLGLPSAAKLIGTVCRLVPDKGCADALMVLSRLPKNWHLAIAGDGPLRSELVKKVEQLRIQDRVHFLGFIQDPCVVYAAIDAFILGIRFEPFGMVIAEAMAAQVPVFLLGGEGGYRESTCPLVTTENAIVIERRKQADRYGIESLDVIDELAAAIQRIDADRRARREMVKTARAWVEKHFSGSSAASSTALVYRGALGSR
jgi:glycosyltransferase involved in cell wall biosynthesis